MSSTPAQISEKVANYAGQFSSVFVLVCRQPELRQYDGKEKFHQVLALAQRNFALNDSITVMNHQSLYDNAYIFEVIPPQEPAAAGPHWTFQNYMTATSPRSLIKLGRLHASDIDTDAIRQTCTNIPVPRFGTTQDSRSWTMQVVSVLRDWGLVHFQRLDNSRQVEQIDTRALFADLTHWARVRNSSPNITLKSHYAPLARDSAGLKGSQRSAEANGFSPPTSDAAN